MRRALRVAKALFVLPILLTALAAGSASADALVPAATQAPQPLIPVAQDQQEQPLSNHALALRVRWVTVPGWELAPYLTEHTQLNAGWSVGLEYLYRHPGWDVVVSLDYSTFNADDGNYLASGHDPTTDDHYLHFDGLSSLSADVSLIGHWNVLPWLEIRLGGGLGLGGVFGNIYQITNSTGCNTATAGDSTKCYPAGIGPLNPSNSNTPNILATHACAGGNGSLDTPGAPCYRVTTTYPFDVRVIPVINALIGLRFKVQRHVFIHADGGFRLAGFYAGVGPEYQF